MPLRLIVENSEPDAVAPQTAYPSADFIQAAIRAAKHSRHSARTKIIADVCDILDCSKKDLDFLFMPQTARADFHFPDYRRETAFLEAAE